MKIPRRCRAYFQRSDYCAIVNGMPSFLKEKRQALGKDLQEFADATRIRASYLRAIEEGCFDSLPVPVYTRGYIRDYARALGVDPAPVLAAYEKHLHGPEKAEVDMPSVPALCDFPAAAAEAEASAPEAPARSVTLTVEREIQLEEHKAGGRSLKLSLIFFMILITVGGFVLYQMYGTGGNQSMKQIVPDVILKEPAKPAELQQRAAETSPAPASGTAAPSVTASERTPESSRPSPTVSPATSAGKKHVLSLNAVEKVWVQVILDKADKKEMLLNPGDAVRFEAADSFRLWIGNAAGLKLSLDGKEVAHGGKPGQSLRLVLPDTTGGQQPQKKVDAPLQKPSDQKTPQSKPAFGQ